MRDLPGPLRRVAAPLALLAALTASAEAKAFCGFYVGGADAKLFNNATMVVLMREGTRTVLSMQNNYEGPPSDFALVVPVPIVLQKENVKTLPREVFQHVDTLAAPRLVEYWEQDPCASNGERDAVGGAKRSKAASAPMMEGAAKGLGVKIEAEFSVGEYEVVVLSAQDSSGLDTWLHQNNYKIPDGAEPILRPYVAAGMKFFVAKVDTKKVRFENGQAMLSPLRFHYDSDSFSLPVRLGLLNSAGTQDLIVHILSRGKRYEVSNYPNVPIPTNYDVVEGVKDQFGEFYAALFDKTVESNPGAVVTEYSWDAQSCDPCPTPALRPGDIATLGADALVTAEAPATDPSFVPSARISDITASGVKGADGRLESYQRSFLQCYLASLSQQSSPKGTARISLKLEDTGRVADVKTEADKGLPASVLQCVTRALRTASFMVERGPAPAVSFSLKLDVRAPEPGEPGWYHPPLPNLNGFTLTRLHARYGKDGLGQDLVFKEAGGIIGGREERGAQQQEHGTKAANVNNFQGRYIIRHPWTGSVSCRDPRRGVWGGPPSGGGPEARAARDTAFAPRGKVVLASLVREPMPELKLTPTGGSRSEARSSGCGSCSATAAPSPLLPGSIAALLALGWRARRRRRCT